MIRIIFDWPHSLINIVFWHVAFLFTKDTSTCDTYLNALRDDITVKHNRSCAAGINAGIVKDDVIYDTSIVANSVVTSYGLTCKWHFLTQVHYRTCKYKFDTYCVPNNIHKSEPYKTFMFPVSKCFIDIWSSNICRYPHWFTGMGCYFWLLWT